jgi:hypothetical protein
MDESLTISKSNAELQSMRYEELREQGLKHIVELSRKIWTDYNSHDPGITILEVLCYAITDLGHRSNQKIEDILTPDPSNPALRDIKNFFTASEILPNKPLTITDLRKLIIDVAADVEVDGDIVETVGVKNAWLELASEPEVPLWAAKAASKLKKSPPDAGNEAEGRLEMNALYNVLLEFETSETYGDLNRHILRERFSFTGTGPEVLSEAVIHVEMNLPRWDRDDVDWDDTHAVRSAAADIDIHVRNLPAGYRIQFEPDSDKMFSLSGRDPDNQPMVLNAVEEAFNQKLNEWVENYRGRVEMVFRILDAVKLKLHANRNLCEDYLKFSALRVESIAICADVEVAVDADVEEVHARILYDTGRFLSPSIRFYELSEMVEKGIPSEKIFEGPFTDHGFVIDDELRKAGRRNVIYVSDLIQIIMNIEGVIAVKQIEIANIPESDEDGIEQRSVRWCLELAYDKNYVPRLSVQNSRLTYFKEQLPYQPARSAVDARLQELESESETGRLKRKRRDFDAPKGRYLELDQYSSITEEFPLTYGIGPDGLPPTATPESRAQARQLKAYLLFFEQLFANYMSQIAHVKDLFSMNAERNADGRFRIGRTYFTKQLSNIVPDGDELYTDLLNHAGNLNRIAESKEVFLIRRNKFLDHLMARFAEQFTDYASLTWRLAGKEGKRSLIQDKLSFLNAYPEISSGRGLGFNFMDGCRIWHLENRSGLQKRASLQVGIDEKQVSDLEFSPNFHIYEDGGRHHFEVRNNSSEAVMVSTLAGFESRTDALAALELIVVSGVQRQFYRITETGTGHSIELYCGDRVMAVSKENDIPDQDEAEDLISEAITLIEQEFYNNPESNRKNFSAPVHNYFRIEKNQDGKEYTVAYKLSGVAFSDKDEDVLLTGKTVGSAETVQQATVLMNERAEEFVWDVIMHGGSIDRYRYIDDEGDWRLQLCGIQGGVLGTSTSMNFNDFIAEQLNNLSEKEILISHPGTEEVEVVKITDAEADGRIVKITLAEAGTIPKQGSTVSYRDELSFEADLEANAFIIEDDLSMKFYTVEKLILSIPGESEPDQIPFEIDRISILEEHTRIYVKSVIPDLADGSRLIFERSFEMTHAQGDEVHIKGGMEEFAARELSRFITKKFLSSEGMHLVEHILLRPKTMDDALMPIFIDPDCEHCQLDNPYTYICSVVLPYWQGRFVNMDFRKFLERKIRYEAPAHVFLKICWVSNSQLTEFENRYKKWLVLNSSDQVNDDDRAEALEQLISILFELRNVYRVGRLHDCEESETYEEAIILNNSTLGSS